MSMLPRIRKFAFAATLAAAGTLSADAATIVTDLGTMLVRSARDARVADLGSMVVTATRNETESDGRFLSAR